MKMDIDRHGPRLMPNNCHHLDPPYFSLPTTFKERKVDLMLLLVTTDNKMMREPWVKADGESTEGMLGIGQEKPESVVITDFYYKTEGFEQVLRRC